MTLLMSSSFDAVARSHADRVAVVEGETRLVYRDLLSWSESVTRAVDPGAGLDGRRVAMMLPNSAGFVATFFGIARAGGVVAPLNIDYREKELVFYLQDIDPAAVVVAPQAVDRVREAIAELERRPRLIVVDEPDQVTTLDDGDGADTTRSQGESPLLLLYTSGSTGRPKRVVRTHAHLSAEIDCLLEVFAVTHEDRFLGAAPFSHVNGLVRTMLTSMTAGAELHPVAKYSRRPVLRKLQEDRITFMGGVPHMFILLARTPTREEVRLTDLRLAFCSSAPLPPDDNRLFAERYGVWVRQLYGSSETGTMSYNIEPDPSQHTEGVGQPLPGVEIVVMDELGGILPPDTEGELAIRSPFAITSYEGNEAATAKSFRNGYYLSGDVGEMDAEGFVKLVGRKSLMINRGGFKVNPYEVEEAILKHPAVDDVGVTGAPSPHGDQIVFAAIVTNADITAEEVARFLQDRIASYKIPSRIEFRDALPKSAAGKVLRHQL